MGLVFILSDDRKKIAWHLCNWFDLVRMEKEYKRIGSSLWNKIVPLSKLYAYTVCIVEVTEDYVLIALLVLLPWN